MIERPKKGFGIPLDDWLRGPLRDWADALLNKELINSEGLLNANTVQKYGMIMLKGKQIEAHYYGIYLCFSYG